MPSKQVKINIQKLDNEIGAVADALNGLTTGDPDYKPTLKKLTKLLALKEEYFQKNKTELRDWIPAIGTASAVLLIVAFEAFGHSVTSKALTFIKPKAI